MLDGLDDILNKLGRYKCPLGDLDDKMPAQSPSNSIQMFEIGSCSKKLAYKLMGYSALPYNFATQRNFEISRKGEAYAKARLIQDGYEIHHQKYGVEFMGITGQIDGIIIFNNEPHLLEVKSVVKYSNFKYLLEEGILNNKFIYSQIQAYLASISKVKRCLLVLQGGFDTGDWETCNHKMVVDANREYQSKLKDKITKIKIKVTSDELPHPDNDVTEEECNNCNYRNHCKGASNVRQSHVTKNGTEKIFPLKNEEAVKGESTILSCGGCKRLLRVPTNRGKLKIRCPKCGYQEEFQPAN